MVMLGAALGGAVLAHAGFTAVLGMSAAIGLAGAALVPVLFRQR